MVGDEHVDAFWRAESDAALHAYLAVIGEDDHPFGVVSHGERHFGFAVVVVAGTALGVDADGR
ncbi:hypothetical protein D3C86_1369550 [compost metagenome]